MQGRRDAPSLPSNGIYVILSYAYFFSQLIRLFEDQDTWLTVTLDNSYMPVPL